MAAFVLITVFLFGLLHFTLALVVTHLPDAYESRIMRTIRPEFQMIQPVPDPYLQAVTDKLAACAALPYPVETFRFAMDDPNALAAPSGIILINRGMLKQVRNENELAFLIGHELAHFKHRDHLRNMGRLLIQSLLGTLFSDEIGQLTLQVTASEYSQAQELAADAYGLELMQCAYGTVSHATDLFARMNQGGEWQHFLTTHPGFAERVMKMHEEIAARGYDDTGAVIALEKPLANITPPVNESPVSQEGVTTKGALGRITREKVSGH